MLFGRYRFHCTFLEEAVLPPFKGHIFRDMFPQAVKRIVCATRQKTCSECFLTRRCFYPLIHPFRPRTDRHRGRSKREGTDPHLPLPYVIEPPATTDPQFLPGTPFVFDLLLFGRLNETLGIFVRSVEEMGRRGVGERGGSAKRGRFHISHIEVGGARFSPGVVGGWAPEETCLNLKKTLTHPPPDGTTDALTELTLKLVTPLKLPAGRGRPLGLTFFVLIRETLFRITSLCRTYGNGAPRLDERSLSLQARQIITTDDRIHFFDTDRIFRRDKRFFQGTLTGEITYRGNLGPFIPFLKFAEAVHLGLHTTFGLGKIAIGQEKPPRINGERPPTAASS